MTSEQQPFKRREPQKGDRVALKITQSDGSVVWGKSVVEDAYGWSRGVVGFPSLSHHADIVEIAANDYMHGFVYKWDGAFYSAHNSGCRCQLYPWTPETQQLVEAAR